MPDEKKICPVMTTDEGVVDWMFCQEGDCALWDPLLKCCSHMSHVLEGRTNVMQVVAGIVAGFEEDQVRAEEKLVEAEERLTEIVNAPELDGEAAALAQERIGELKGKVDVIGQVCAILRRRFGLAP